MLNTMERIVIIDHETHILYVEDVSEEALAKYNGEEEAYIRDNYNLEGDFSWDYIRGMEYIQGLDEDPVDIFDLEGAFGIDV